MTHDLDWWSLIEEKIWIIFLEFPHGFSTSTYQRNQFPKLWQLLTQNLKIIQLIIQDHPINHPSQSLSNLMSRKIPTIIEQNPPMSHSLSIFHIWRHDLFRVESEAFQSAREGMLSSRMMGPCSITPCPITPVTNRILAMFVIWKETWAKHQPMTHWKWPDLSNYQMSKMSSYSMVKYH